MDVSTLQVTLLTFASTSMARQKWLVVDSAQASTLLCQKVCAAAEQRHHAFLADLDAREGVADGAGDAVTVVGVRGGDARFGHAVALTDPMPGSIAERSEGRFCEWRGPTREQPHRRASLGGEAR